MTGAPSRGWAVAALLLLAVCAHLAGLGNGFVWDDDRYVTENPALESGAGLRAIWTDAATTPQYYPLTHTTFWVEYQLWKLQPLGYHAGNILLHAAAAALLFLILRSLAVPGAWVAAAIFAVHPIQVESVAWVTERKNVLSGALYLASLLAWVRYFRLDRDGASEQVESPRWALAGLSLFTLALLAKTVTATLPLTLALLLWYRGRRPGPRFVLFGSTMLAGGALLASLTAWLEQHQVRALGEEWSAGLLERGLIAGRVWCFYLGQLVWPGDLSFVYPRWEIDVADPTAWVWPLAVAGTLATLWLLRQRIGRGPLVALLHYSVALIPASGLFNVYPMRYSYVADHFQYLAGIGPVVLLVAAVARVPWPAASLRVWRSGLAACLILLLGILSWRHTAAFESSSTLWRATLARNPAAWIAHNNLGILEAEAGRDDQARVHFLEVVRLKPDHAGARSNLALLLLRQDRAAEALPQVEAALALRSDDVASWIVLGDVRRRLGDTAGAADAYTSALRLDPSNALAAWGSGELELQARRFDRAARHLAVAVRAAPASAALRFKLGSALAAAGRNAAAVEQFQFLLRLEPENADAHYNLGTLLARADRPREAALHLAEALRLRPGFEDAAINLRQVRRRLAGESADR